VLTASPCTTVPCRTVGRVLERFNSPARRVVALAEEEAQRLGHGHVGTEHLLLGMLAEGESSAARALVASGATLEGCRHKVLEAVPVESQGRAPGELQFTDRARRTLERAGRLSLRQHDEQVGTQHILLSLLDVEGTAGQALRGLAVDLARLRLALDSTEEHAGRGAGKGEVAERDGPRCGVCGSPLDNALAHRVLTSRSRTRQSQQFVVAYCVICGSVVGATAV
jgi:ATP-dependent Clp protease ATP-binding subunit ClpA